MILKAAAATAAVFLAAATLPFLMVPGASGPDIVNADSSAACGELGVILDTIRTVETGGNYQTRIAAATASGAYAFIDATWQHFAVVAGVDTGAYPSAWMAPPDQQDAVAAVAVNQLLDEHHGQVDLVPVGWYVPAALDNPALMDQIPSPETGNRLTVRQYQLKWLDVYRHKVADNPPDPGGVSTSCASTITVDGHWALPAPRDSLTSAGIASPHHDYPAVDLMMTEGTAVFAVTGGTVVRTTHFNRNWWTAGCNSNQPPSGCATCGNGITIRDTTGSRYTYCHNRTLYVHDGEQIATGQHIADSGNTGRSGGPHLHFEIRVNNIQRCPQQPLRALYNQQPPPNVATLPTTGCSF